MAGASLGVATKAVIGVGLALGTLTLAAAAGVPGVSAALSGFFSVTGISGFVNSLFGGLSGSGSGGIQIGL